jgi:Zn finger protein HypA/HybF involved in hydrogenase expression
MQGTQVPAVRVKSSEDLLNKGEYVFIQARKPEVRSEKTPIAAPSGKLAQWLWLRVGKKYETKEIVTEVWPKIDTVILNCPKCNGTLGTTKEHTILSVEPLKLDLPLTCPYCRSFTFEVKEGNLIELNEINAIAVA